MAWSGTGINYGHHSPSNPYDFNQVDKDLKLIKSLGFTWVSIAMPPYSDKTALGTDNSQQLALRAKAAGLKVAWGTVARYSDTYNLTSWNNYLNEIHNAGVWAYENDIDEWHIGNEHEWRGVFVTSITRSDTTATITTQYPHGFSTGDTVTMIWAAPEGYNGDFEITVTGPTTFTYTVSASLPETGSSAPGVTARCRNYTAAKIGNDICGKAAEIKTTFPGLKIAYRTSSSKEAVWAARSDLGGLDYIGFNIYGYVSQIGAQLRTIRQRWGNKAIITEWSTNNGFQNRNDETKWETDIAEVMQFIRHLGYERTFYFCFRDGGFGVPQDKWAIMTSNNELRLAVQPLVGGRKWLV